jgi:hypothetical protein
MTSTIEQTGTPALASAQTKAMTKPGVGARRARVATAKPPRRATGGDGDVRRFRCYGGASLR